MSSKTKDTSMTPKAQCALVPKLRIPEFRDAREWEEKTLSEACRVTQGGTPDTAATDLWGGSIQWLTPAEMGKDDSKYIAKTVRSITEKGLSNCSSELLPINSVIISTRAPIGHLAINTEPMAINQGCRGLIPKTSFDALFIYYYLAKSRTQLNDLGSGNTFKEISGKTLKEFVIAFPLFAEQQKIADSLSSIDELITLEARKIDALKTHKKGLMQQLFPAEGETLPKLRFPEFRDAGEWVRKTLGDIAKIRSGSTPLRANADYYNGGHIPWVKTADLNNSYIVSTEEFITSKAKAKINPEGAVLVAMYGGFNQIGRTGYLKIPAATNQAISVLEADREIMLPIYLLMWLNAKVELWKRIASSSRKDPNVTGADVTNFPVAYPCIGEQQKIADCLSSIDDLIALQTKKLDALKVHKKGLMQQLFPSLGEVRE